MGWEPEEKFRIDSEGDIVSVRKAVRDAATALGFGVTDVNMHNTGPGVIGFNGRIRNLLRCDGNVRILCPGWCAADNRTGDDDFVHTVPS